jgi:hypothetical protein
MMVMSLIPSRGPGGFIQKLKNKIRGSQGYVPVAQYDYEDEENSSVLGLQLEDYNVGYVDEDPFETVSDEDDELREFEIADNPDDENSLI